MESIDVTSPQVMYQVTVKQNGQIRSIHQSRQVNVCTLGPWVCEFMHSQVGRQDACCINFWQILIENFTTRVSDGMKWFIKILEVADWRCKKHQVEFLQTFLSNLLTISVLRYEPKFPMSLIYHWCHYYYLRTRIAHKVVLHIRPLQPMLVIMT